jgi:hypothetical protein
MLEISGFLTHFDHVSMRDEALARAPDGLSRTGE